MWRDGRPVERAIREDGTFVNRHVVTASGVVVVVLALVGGVVLFGLSSDSRADAAEASKADVAAQRAVWESTGIANYVMTYRTICFCPFVADMEVVVRDGVLVSAINGGRRDRDGSVRCL